MSNKPSTVSSWASSASFVIEPSSGQKNAGFSPGGQLPADWINWILKNIAEWVSYLNDPNAITIGASMLSSIANAHAARLIVAPASHGTAHYTLIGSFGDARIYIGSSTKLCLVIAYNAAQDGSNTWGKITTSQPATALYIERGSIRVVSMPSAQNTAWTDAFVEGEGTTSGWGSLLYYNADTESETNSESDFPERMIQAPTTAGTDRKLLLHIKKASTNDIRLYYVTTGAIEITFNAKWTNSTDLWALDIASTAMKLSLSEGALRLQRKNTGTIPTTWNDSSWDSAPINFVPQSTTSAGTSDDNLLELRNAQIRMTSPLNADVEDTNPPSTGALPTNTLCAKVICKAWGLVNVTAGGTATILDGVNIGSVSASTGSDTVTVTFATNMQSGDYAVIATADGSGINRIVSVVSRSTSQIVFNLFDGATQVNIGSTACVFSFTVFARQD